MNALDKRAMAIYLSGKTSLKEAYEIAKSELLYNEIPEPVRDLFRRK